MESETLSALEARGPPADDRFAAREDRSSMNAISAMPLHSLSPELGTAPIPIEPYLSADYYQKEIDKIFKRDWLCVGRDEELPNPGDYKVKRLDFAKTSAILIRGKDGKVRAFHN